MDVARLGQGVDTTGRFDPQALARTLDYVSEYARSCAGGSVWNRFASLPHQQPGMRLTARVCFRRAAPAWRKPAGINW